MSVRHLLKVRGPFDINELSSPVALGATRVKLPLNNFVVGTASSLDPCMQATPLSTTDNRRVYTAVLQ